MLHVNTVTLVFLKTKKSCILKTKTHTHVDGVLEQLENKGQVKHVRKKENNFQKKYCCQSVG